MLCDDGLLCIRGQQRWTGPEKTTDDLDCKNQFAQIMIQIMFIYMYEFFVALQQLFRHGAKNPSGFYPNDPHAAHDWQEGLGALTQASIESNTIGDLVL